MSFSIAGKTAIVTGAANGIGLAISRAFAEQGANVMMVDMDDKQLSKEAGDLPEDGNVAHFCRGSARTADHRQSAFPPRWITLSAWTF